jgi:hypothetical protein
MNSATGDHDGGFLWNGIWPRFAHPALVFCAIAPARKGRCNASMILRRLIAWLRRPRPSRPQKPPEVYSDGGPLDLNEFERLLNSGETEDLQKIARALGRRETSGFSASTKSREVIYGAGSGRVDAR